jgi:hypothetical protein
VVVVVVCECVSVWEGVSECRSVGVEADMYKYMHTHDVRETLRI